MAQINWPIYNITPTITHPIELESADIRLRYPGRRTIKAEFSNKELVYDVSEGEWAGEIVIAFANRNSDRHRKVQTLIAEMQDDPGNNWTLIPWDFPSIYTLNSVWNPTSPIEGNNNSQLTHIERVDNGVGTVRALTTTAGETITITPGEHFGYMDRTYKIVTATATGQGRWNIQTVPQLPEATTASPIFKRNFIPMRFVGGQDISDSQVGRQAGPWGISVVEFLTD